MLKFNLLANRRGSSARGQLIYPDRAHFNQHIMEIIRKKAQVQFARTRKAETIIIAPTKDNYNRRLLHIIQRAHTSQLPYVFVCVSVAARRPSDDGMNGAFRQIL
jgi:hypothetical protein